MTKKKTPEKKPKAKKIKLTEKHKKMLAAFAFFVFPLLVNFAVGFEFGVAVAVIEIVLLAWLSRKFEKK